MKKWLAFLLISVFTLSAFSQPAGPVKRDLSPEEISRIIKKVTENEADFRGALTSYVFNRYATINTIGLGGQITGTYRRDSFMTFTQDGGRFERVLFSPIATTPPGFVTPEDLEDLGGVNPFALDPSVVGQYNFSYIGTEKIDDLTLHVFEVRPKTIPDPKKTKLRMFTGRVWVDVDDLMIVKSRGKAVPETKTKQYQSDTTTR